MRCARVVTLLLAGALGAPTASAQTVLFEENFDAGIPANWANIQLGYHGDIWESGFKLVNGSKDVYHEGWCDHGFYFRDNILRSPPIDLTGVTNVTFEAEQFQSLAHLMFYNAIEVSTDGGATYEVLHKLVSPPNGFSKITANMDAYAGLPDVRIALHYKGYATNNWSVDSIRVTTPWANLGGSLGGGALVAPKLTATGSLVGDTAVSLALDTDTPGLPALLIIGGSRIDLPIGGGVLVPSVDYVFAYVTDAGGDVAETGRWPTGLPPGLDVYFQFWVVGDHGPVALQASNAVSGTTP